MDNPFPFNIYTYIYIYLLPLRHSVNTQSPSPQPKNKKKKSTIDIVEQAKHFVAEKVANMPKPEATITDVDLKGFGFDGITYLAKIAVSNPYSFPIPIGEIAYKVKSSGRGIASGSIPDPGSLKASDKTMLNVTIKVPHSVLISLIRDIGADWDIDYEIELGLIIDIPVIGNFTIPMSYKGEMKLPTLSDFLKRNQPVEMEAVPAPAEA